MIPSDFHVSLVAQTNTHSIFAALRDDVWHFIFVAGEGRNQQLLQRHIPRYTVAKAINSLELKAKQGIPSDSILVTKESRRGDVAFFPNGTLGIIYGESIIPVIHDEARKFSTDVEILHSLEKGISEQQGKFILQNAKTHGGNIVQASSRELIEAIAFERELRGYLDARSFAVYSAFCTWLDFIAPSESERMRDILSGVAEQYSQIDFGSDDGDSYLNSLMEVQERVWGTVLCGPGKSTTKDELARHFISSLEGVGGFKFSQFVLLNGMQSGGPFHPIALLTGLMDWDEFNYWRTFPFQADSDEEQQIRTQNASIQLLGQLAP